MSRIEAGADLLQPSPQHKNDCSELIGKDPRDVPVEILSLYYREKNPLKAIRARCLDCCCDQPSEVRKCVSVECPAWPFRMGTNPFRKKRELSPEQRRKATERLSGASQTLSTANLSTDQDARACRHVESIEEDNLHD